ncbi:MAG: PIN domain-containing protein [Proteobacteria bacterium]|nr:PIN domain-containing protein [Pseudomonadota bacterium]
MEKPFDIAATAHARFLYGRHRHVIGTFYILPLTPAIAELAESGIITHGNPGDQLIAATAITHQVPLITADEKLHAVPGLRCIW